MDEIQIAVARLAGTEEGFRSQLYDDATGKLVKAPVGNATIGIGENVQSGWDRDFAIEVLNLRVTRLATWLSQFEWYTKCNAVRRSVLLDIAFNDGPTGLLHFYKMIAAILADNWAEAKDQCMVKNPQLKGRYDHLGELMDTGILPGSVPAS